MQKESIYIKSRLGQFIFTFREVTKLAFKVNPRFLKSVFIINIFSGILVAPTLYLHKLIIDTLIDGVKRQSFDEVFLKLCVYIFLSIALGFTQILINRANGFMRGILSRGFYSELEILKSKKLAELDLATIESHSFKKRYTKISDESHRAYSFISPVSNIPENVVSLVSSFLILATLSPFAALAIILASLPRVFINAKLISERYDLSTSLSSLRLEQGWLNYYLLRNRNFMELKLLNLIPFLAKKYETNEKFILDKREAYDWKWEKSTLFSFLPLTLVDGAVTVWMGFLVLGVKITVGSFQLYFQALKRVQAEFQDFATSIMDIYENYLYVSELVWFLELTPKIENQKGREVSFEAPLKIEFKNVWFRYKKSEGWTLKNINLTLNEGEHLAIVGLNGAGKSTLLKLLARFYDPQKGEILINGIKLSEINSHWWREKMTMLFQEFEAYPFSARESIGYGDAARIHEIEKIKEAAKKTKIHAYIEKLHKGYETPLAPEFEGGAKPSVGQWQRIGISRILFRENAKILVLDEPTSNVDPEAEEQIFEELSKVSGNKILIFVTQRFSTVRIAQKIIVIENGRIIEEGSHSELYKKKGTYKRLFDLQAKGYKV